MAKRFSQEGAILDQIQKSISLPLQQYISNLFTFTSTMHYQTILKYARRMRSKPTLAEFHFWQHVRKREFMDKKFTRQYIIQHEEVHGIKQFFIADFYCHEHKLILEIDGAIHQSQIEYDQIREEKLVQMGYHVLRFSNHNVINRWDEVLESLIDFFEKA